ncbi:MAG: HDIG domain-containing metalloprotein, partial [Chloroflexia bacterium]
LASETDLSVARAALLDRLPSVLTQDQKEGAVAFVSPMLAVNMRLDDDQTTQRRDQAAANVKPVIQVVQKGEAILRQGELATPEAIEKMQEAGLLRRDLSFVGVAGTGALVGLLMLLLHLYIFRYAPQVWQRQRHILLIASMIFGTIVVARFFLPGHAFLPYLMPLAAVAMLIAVLINTNVAVLVTLVLSVLTVLVASGTNLPMDLTLYYFISGLAGIFSLTRVERVSTFARAGIFITLSAFITVLTLKVITAAPIDWPSLQNYALASIFNGVVSASITYAAFSLLGTIFGITTPVQLMELAHPDQPVLRRLMREAPGTYHHSLVVSNLAERAAEMIGADALLTRVSAYYHDIGKVVRPAHFIDNQSGMKNIHDTLDPRESARIIMSHVSDGVDLGRKNRLPKRILDAIPQHHGTMLIQYFYHKAVLADPTTNPDNFRYPGPKPQTKENAILMLADGVEATVRAMAQAGALDRPPTRNSDASETVGLYNDTASLPNDTLVQTVHRIISERIEDGQLDECDLTVRDIARIQEAFVSMLKGIYHPRIQYPSNDAKQSDPKQPDTQQKTLAPTPITSPLTNGMAAASNSANTLESGSGRSLIQSGQSREP